jgi:RNA polymerase sigma-70 factor (ECF subfamily)
VSIEALYNENELLDQLAQGNAAAFTTIYRTYWKPLYFLAHNHLRSAEAAEEIVQEVFLMLWKKRAELTIHSPGLYLAAMTRYAVYRHLAKEKKAMVQNAGAMADQFLCEDATSNLDHKLLLEMVTKLSARLPEKCRLVFINNKLLDQPLQEVAEQLNISTKTAEAHLTKALKIMRSQLGNTSSFFLLF